MTPIHAKYSASGAHRWLVCGASVGYTDETTSEYAEEGARLHKLAEQGEIAEYKEFIKELNCTEVMYEKRVELVAYFAYGTADCIAYDSHTASIYVIDLKTGHNYPEAMDNPQLAFYACSLYGADEVTCYIYHLPTKSHKGWTMKQEDLKKWRRKFIDRIIEIEYQGKDKEFVEGEHCKYCPRAKSCPKLNKLALDYDKIDAYTLLKSKKLIEKHIDAVENDIRERLTKGEEIQGFMLKQGRKLKSWALDDAELKAELEKRGLKYLVEKPITPNDEGVPEDLVKIVFAKGTVVVK